jgi:hypothetical protein
MSAEQIEDAVAGVIEAAGEWPSAAAPDKVSAVLNHRAAEALRLAMEYTGAGKTEAVNRALVLYGTVAAALDAGGEVKVRESAGAELERVLFL